MDCKEEIVDSRIPDPKAFEIGSKNAQILFKLNHTMPMTEEYGKVVKELFGDNIGEGTMLTAPLQGVCIGKHAVVGAGSVVTKDIPDYAVAVGCPAKVVRMLNPEKFA